jgi:hypothetical protein
MEGMRPPPGTMGGWGSPEVPCLISISWTTVGGAGTRWEGVWEPVVQAR